MRKIVRGVLEEYVAAAGRGLPDRLPGAARLLAARRGAAGVAFSPRPARPGPRPAAAGLPGVVHLAACVGGEAAAAARAASGPAAGGHGPDRRPHPPAVPLRVDGRPASGDRRDFRRHGRAAADEPPVAGRRGERQDGGGLVCHAAGGGPSLPGGAHGAHGSPRPATCPDAGKAAGGQPGPPRATDRRDAGQAADGAAGTDRRRPGRPGGGHAGGDPGGRAIRPAGAGGDRRAAQVRRPPAGELEARRPRPALPGDDRHAHPADRDHDAIRRPGRVAAGGKPAGPAEGAHLPGRRRPACPLVGILPPQAPRGAAGLRDRPAGRGIRPVRQRQPGRDLRDAGQRPAGGLPPGPGPRADDDEPRRTP